MDNLPKWPGASECYTRAYKLLETMANTSHITKVHIRGNKQKCYVSAEMNNLISALDTGDEEIIKATLLQSNSMMLLNRGYESRRDY